ncbi:hypothetical protein IWQ56_004922, partial [Coemansia nantahalensis]
TVVLNLYRVDVNIVKECQDQCSDSRCRGQCEKTGLSDEEILIRTQRCTDRCQERPSELIHMCIQHCTYYLVDPVGHVAEMEMGPESSVGEDGLLLDNEHLRTRIRLIGPDGLPLSDDDDDGDYSYSYKSTSQYRVVLVGSGRQHLSPGTVAASAVAVALAWLV